MNSSACIQLLCIKSPHKKTSPSPKPLYVSRERQCEHQAKKTRFERFGTVGQQIKSTEAENELFENFAYFYKKIILTDRNRKQKFKNIT
ncbi:MAG TPA: hypothetical protein GXZ99_01540 [Bacteroidales bacterium]|nr:hypothetical protein [Bacteroidales bacterium]